MKWSLLILSNAFLLLAGILADLVYCGSACTGWLAVACAVCGVMWFGCACAVWNCR